MNSGGEESGAALVLVESNTTGTGRLFAAAARRLGLTPVLLAAEPGRYPYAALDGLAMQQLDTSDAGALRDAVQALRRAHDVVGVTTSSDYYVVAAARLAGELGLPGVDAEALVRCRDKGAQRRALASAGVNGPVAIECEDAFEAAAAAQAIGGAVVVKPVEGSGSVGVRLCRDAGEAGEHAARLLAVRHNERGLPIAARVLVEALLPGDEVSVEIVAGQVIGVTGKHLGAPPSFVEIGHDAPLRSTEASSAEEAEKLALAALAALGLAGATAHVELKLDAGRAAIVEVNPRLAGGFIPELWRLARGIDAVTAVVAAAAGLAPDLRVRHRRAAAIRFVLPREQGQWRAVRGLDEARQVPGVHEVALLREPAGELLLRGDFRDRVGHVIAVAEDGDGAAAAAAANAALGRIELVIERDGAGLGLDGGGGR
jgi:S-sulfo-L-cysteine synthase (3-phospho-L-serine-dependent)